MTDLDIKQLKLPEWSHPVIDSLRDKIQYLFPVSYYDDLTLIMQSLVITDVYGNGYAVQGVHEVDFDQEYIILECINLETGEPGLVVSTPVWSSEENEELHEVLTTEYPELNTFYLLDSFSYNNRKEL